MGDECGLMWRKLISMSHRTIFLLLSWSLTFWTDFTRRSCPETVQSARRCPASSQRWGLLKNRTIILSVASPCDWLSRNSSFIQLLVECGPCCSGRISCFPRSLISEHLGLSFLGLTFPLWGRVSRMFQRYLTFFRAAFFITILGIRIFMMFLCSNSLYELAALDLRSHNFWPSYVVRHCVYGSRIFHEPVTQKKALSKAS